MGLTPHPRLECRGPRKSRAIPLLTLRVCVAYKKGENLPTKVYGIFRLMVPGDLADYTTEDYGIFRQTAAALHPKLD